MSPQNPNRRPGWARKPASRLVGLAALVVAAFAAASPARAESAFRDGFEYELGRIAAHHVAGIGTLLLHVGPPHVVLRDHGPPHLARHRAVRAHHRSHPRHSRAAHRWAHRHHGPCGVAHRRHGGRRH